MRDEVTTVDGHELKDLKKVFLFARKVSFGLRNDKPIMIITPEDGQTIETIVWANSQNKKDIA